MYKPSKDWLNFVEITPEFPCALTYSVNDSVKPIIMYFVTVKSLVESIRMCQDKCYDYDFTLGFSELTEKEYKELEEIGVYVP